MRIRIEGRDLPGRRTGAAAEQLRRQNVQVGVQRKAEVVGRVPCTAESAAWDLDVTAREIDGLLDVGGPWVHGRPGARFLYLSWGAVDGETFTMFRRAKLMFADIPTQLLRSVFEGDGSLQAELALTDAAGDPVCARIKPPEIVWTAR